MIYFSPLLSPHRGDSGGLHSPREALRAQRGAYPLDGLLSLSNRCRAYLAALWNYFRNKMLLERACHAGQSTNSISTLEIGNHFL